MVRRSQGKEEKEKPRTTTPGHGYNGQSQCSGFLRTRLGELRSSVVFFDYSLYVCFSFVRVFEL